MINSRLLNNAARLISLAVKTCCRWVLCAFLVGCASEPQHITSTFVHRETLFAGARAGAESGFRLLRVDHDGTAYIRSPDDRRIHRVRPEKDDGIAGDDKQVEPWTLEATDPVKQTATLSILVDG